MIRIIHIVFFLIIFIESAYADRFKLRYNSGRDGIYNVGNTEVKLFDSNNNSIFTGKSDKFGNITINIPRGIYTIRVNYRSRSLTADINIINSNTRRPINFR